MGQPGPLGIAYPAWGKGCACCAVAVCQSVWQLEPAHANGASPNHTAAQQNGGFGVGVSARQSVRPLEHVHTNGASAIAQPPNGGGVGVGLSHYGALPTCGSIRGGMVTMEDCGVGEWIQVKSAICKEVAHSQSLHSNVS